MTTSPLANPTATREMLEAFGLATKHRLGQNFLIDNHVIERIMALAELTGSERVLEVGPGIGTLTLALVQEATRVTTMPSLRRAVVMVQKEVADRIAAVPGTKAYGAYTVKLSLYGEVTGRFEVPPRCFMPAPHVDSAVVRIDRVDASDAEGVGAASAFEACGISPTARAEALTTEDFIALAASLTSAPGGE